MKFLAFSFIFVLFTSLSARQTGKVPGDGWSLVKNENGIQVFVRKVPGSSFHEFKGIAVVNSKIEVIGEILRDVPYYPQWIPDCTDASVIKRTDRNNLMLHFSQKLPWPVDNRDVVLSAKTIFDLNNGKITITMESVNDSKYPVKEGFTRMSEMKGCYILEYIDREHTKLSYIVKANPGGSIPSSVVNSSSKDIPYNTLTGIKKVSSMKRFIEAGSKAEERLKIEEMISKGILKK